MTKFDMTETKLGYIWTLNVDDKFAGTGTIVLGDYTPPRDKAPLSPVVYYLIEKQKIFAVSTSVVVPESDQACERDAYITGALDFGAATPEEILNLIKDYLYSLTR